MTLTVAPLLIVALGGSVAFALALWFKRWIPAIPVTASLLGGAMTLWAWLSEAEGVDLPWASEWGSRLTLEIDGLGALFSMLATGVGAGVILYSPAYLAGKPTRLILRYNAWLILFLMSMIGLSLAQDMLLMFVAFDLTTLCSYQLIATERQDDEARSAAFAALIVTGITSTMFLVGSVLIASTTGSFALAATLNAPASETAVQLGTILIVIAALAKSAQVPLHFWLLRAMAGPTPVSAYLHSAAMVAAGVFVLARIDPLLESVPGLQPVLVAVGVSSIAVGGFSALMVDDMKRILAYSTIAQYGFMVVLLSLERSTAAMAFPFYVLTHGIAKSSLFLCAGAVAEATQEETLSKLGGLARRLPWLAIGAGIAAATLAGLPLTMGFFKDELLFGASLEGSPWLPATIVVGAALTFSYMARFWYGIFMGPSREVDSLQPSWTIPVVVSAAVLIIGGLFTAPFEAIAEAAAATTIHRPVFEELAYHFDARPENIMAIVAYAGGFLLFRVRRTFGHRPLLTELPARFGPARAFDEMLRILKQTSDTVHSFELRDLRDRMAAVLIPTGALILLGVVTVGGQRYRVGDLAHTHLRLYLVLGLLVIGAAATAAAKTHRGLVIGLAATSYALAAFFALSGAPDVALVGVLVGTVSTLVWLAIVPRLPEEPASEERTRQARWGRPLVGVSSAAFSFIAVWGTLSDAADHSVADAQLEAARETHTLDAVTAILTDFRSLDTLGEASVVAVAVLGIMTLLRGRGDRR